jgi:cytochrome P450
MLDGGIFGEGGFDNMNRVADISAQIDVRAIPNLDPLPFYKPESSEAGLDRIILPSGHVAFHIKRYDAVRDVLLSRSFLREPSNTVGAATVFPTLTPKELLLNNDFPAHPRLKTLVSRDFSPSGVDTLHPLLSDLIDEGIERMQRHEEGADLFRDLLDHIPSRVICHFLGLPPDDLSYYRPLSYTVQIASRENIPELVRQFNLVYDYLTDLVRGRRASSGDGLVQRMLAMRYDVDPPFTDEEIIGVLIGVLLGGDQNLLTVMTKVVYALLAAPVLFMQLVNDNALIPDAVEELFRLIPLGVVSAFPRIASKDLELSWGRIPKDAAVYPDVYAANRDPEVYDSPFSVHFTRKERRHLQFGYGMHSCMGAALARMEIRAVVEALVTRVPTLHLAVPPARVPWQDGLILRRPTALAVRW